MFFSRIKAKRSSVDNNSMQPIAQMLEQTWDLSRTFTSPGTGQDTHAVDIFNRFFKKLNRIVEAILKNVVALASLAPDLFFFSKDFRTKAKHQEDSVLHISKAAKTMSQRIEHIAGNAQDVSDDGVLIEKEVTQALKLGEDSMEKFARVQARVKELSDTIAVLSNNSQTIGNIIDIINTISDETNILSLNARIEASKSGSAGKGFTVIAQEISELAKQSKDATNDIRDQLTQLASKIQETVTGIKKVETDVLSGGQMITAANESLGGVHTHIAHLSQNMSDIKEALTHQSTDVKHVSGSIEGITQSVQQQAKGVEAIFSVAQQINKICDDMIMDTGIFHLSGHKKAQSTVLQLAEDQDIVSFNVRQQESAMKTALANHPFMELLYITDKNGIQSTRNIYSPKIPDHESLESGINQNRADKEWFKKPSRTQTPFVSRVYRSSATKEFCFTISVPLYDHKQFAGVLGIDISFKDMLNIQ